MRIAVCDDQTHFLTEIERLLFAWPNRPDSFVADFFANSDSLLEAHAHLAYDVLLLDVVMPVINGIEAAREIRQTDQTVKLIFLTSSPEFAVDSYQVKATNYLLKPIQPAALYGVLDELVAEFHKITKHITIKDLHAVYRVSVDAIAYIESQNKHILFYLTDGRILESATPLYSYESDLSFQDGFFKCHRSYIVNLHHIVSYTPKEIKMRLGTLIPISRNLKKDFEEAYFATMFQEAGELR